MPSPICYCEKWPIHEAKAGLFASASHILYRETDRTASAILPTTRQVINTIIL